ncbi:PilX N-terminal domain-containing pilus assembly protein [Alloalcanivorax profundimaris]|uniref:PilX N-terminal domain-containing pilus assembly protein n=1 Tax=Alloalcanivorax profundimaris TaxID=2735259 RepID=UPI001891A7AE|nr:PilX N-terminal domain-containing pilus assembly protein [Alloalcanivorax profundimaris]
MRLAAPTLARTERGAALLIALLILVIVSLMGITAMKTSMFSAKISTGTQVDAMAFEGAESAVSEAYAYLYGLSSAKLQPFLNGQAAYRCLEGSAVKKTRCTGNERLDSRGLVQTQSRIRQKGMQPVSGGQVSMSGGGSMIVDYTFEIMGDSEVEEFEIDNHHLQKALKRGMVASSDFNNIGQE